MPPRDPRYVRDLFDLIAPRYDRFTRWFSYGMDRGWKREVATALATALRERPGATVLDLACGTGDLAEASVRLSAGARVVGLDVSGEMLRLAVARRGSLPILYVRGTMAALPLVDGSVDVVSGGYALRNAEDLDRALDEVARVMRPGGVLVTLDFFLPASAAWRALFLGYLAVAGWIYGWLWHRRPDAYVYIPRSIRRFVTMREYERRLVRRGFTMAAVSGKLLGGVAVHVARRG